MERGKSGATNLSGSKRITAYFWSTKSSYQLISSHWYQFDWKKLVLTWVVQVSILVEEHDIYTSVVYVLVELCEIFQAAISYLLVKLEALHKNKMKTEN